MIAVTKMNANPLETLLTSMNAGGLYRLHGGSADPVAGRPWRPESGAQQSGTAGDESVFGSVLATISLTVPVVTLIAFLTGNELRFGLGAPEMVVMVASLVLCHISFSTGRTNVLNGAAHMALFAAYLMTIFA